ncbi:MAG TPA: MFS transporter [Candidatus Hydrogenedentes bacterium]|nr:MFS transporter [Candidatus Hydrogenedentota bacterium]HOL75651.1 MFS transporter [Candidatus Hydrogenedentota bacterium]HPO84356.1 MFS transporter [Candidatus Hydrogenedentota bacterium]
MKFLRTRLSIMMFLQYAIWGGWCVVGYAFFKEIGFSDTQSSWLFSALWLACIVAPFIGGQIADRYFPTQYFLAIAHLCGGIILLLMGRERNFTPMMTYMAIYCLLYAPTLALTNSICFQNLKDVSRDFGRIRVWGTLGWIAVGWILTFWRRIVEPDVLGDLFYLAGGCSLLLGVFCFFLPHTPPKKEAENPFAFLEALGLLKDKNFAIFLSIAFIVTTELQFYYLPTSVFLEEIGVSKQNVPSVMTVAQIAEIITMALLLPIFLKKVGLRATLALGVIAWPLRYLVFALQKPLWLVIASLAFHGLGYTFFFVASQIYVDNVATSTSRASAQSLLTLVTLGIGNYLGTMFYMVIKNYFTIKQPDGTEITQWSQLFLVPCVLTALCAVAFLIFFKPPESQLSEKNA